MRFTVKANAFIVWMTCGLSHDRPDMAGDNYKYGSPLHFYEITIFFPLRFPMYNFISALAMVDSIVWFL